MKKNFVKVSICALLAIGVVACGGNKGKKGSGEGTADSITTQVAPANSLPMTPEEATLVRAKMDSLMKVPGRVTLSASTTKLFMIPDSILQRTDLVQDPNFDMRKYWTPEQHKFDRILAQIQVDNVKMVDGKIVFDYSREDFVKKGLPGDYYDFLVQSYNDINFFNEVSKVSPEELTKIWENMQTDYKSRLATDGK